jgi:hypothetical protein
VPADFSLVLGGPLYQLFLRLRMARPPLELLRRRLITIPLAAWLPLLVLSAAEGRALGSPGIIPFVHDIEAHVRFLVALPLLILAELVVHVRIMPLVRQFVERGLVTREVRPGFEAILRSLQRLRDSTAIEVGLVVIVLTVGHLLWWQQHSMPTASWYAAPTGQGVRLTWAGTWYGWVSAPIFQFILLRWYFRLFLWMRFLWQVSRLPLRLMPAHPDRTGGLGFLAESPGAFSLVLVAQSALVAGVVAGHVFFHGASLPQFKLELAGIVVILMVLALAPLSFFTFQLARARRRGIEEYGRLAARYVRNFDRKWLRGGAPPDEPLLGSGDIQSLADMGGSLEAVEGMRSLPFSKEVVIRLAITVALPLLPLLLTIVPLEELLTSLVKIVL